MKSQTAAAQFARDSPNLSRARTVPSYILPRRWARSIFALWVILLVTASLASAVYPAAIYAAMGSMACVIATIPLIATSQYNLVSPWSLVALNTYLGCGIRTVFVAFGQDGTRTIDDLFLLGREPTFFVKPGFLYLVGLSLLTLGYYFGFSRHRGREVEDESKASYWERYRFGGHANVVLFLTAAAGFLAFVFYVRATGGFSLAQLSAKRATINGLSLDSNYTSNGGLKALGALSSIAFWLQLTKYCVEQKSHHLFTARGLYLGALFLNAILMPIFASTRSDVIYLVIIAVVIELLTSTRNMTRKLLVMAAVFGIIVLPILTGLRISSQGSTETSNSALLTDTFVYSRTFSDILTSSQIIRAVPERLESAGGETITSWLAAPIPRSLWPDKPIISAGPLIGVQVFGNERSGVPPGLIAESYWNFGVVGILLLPLLFGLFLRPLEWSPVKGRNASPALVALFSVCVFRLGIDAVSNSLGYALFQSAKNFAFVVIVLALAGSAIKKDRPRQQDTSRARTKNSSRR